MYQVFEVGMHYMQSTWSARFAIDNVLDEDGITQYRPPGHSSNHTDPRTYSLTLNAWF